MKQRIKYCGICKVDFPTMYRVQYKNQHCSKKSSVGFLEEFS